MVFRTPITFTIFMVVCLFFLSTLGLFALPYQINNVLEEHETLVVTLSWSAAFVTFFVAAPSLPAVVLFAIVPGPQELRLNKHERTYALRSGTYFKRWSRSGSWEDIEGVIVRVLSGKGDTNYGVHIVWRHSLTGGPCLGLRGKRGQAEELAKVVAQNLGLQLLT